MYMVLVVWVEGEGWFQLADSSGFSSLTAKLDSAKWKGTTVLDMHCFANMVESRESLVN